MEETINLRVRTKLWTKIMRLPSFYYDEDSGDQLVSRVTSDAEAPSSLFSMAVSFVVCIVTSIQAFVQLYSYNTVLANYSLIIIPLTLIVCVIYGKLTFRLGVFGTVTTASSSATSPSACAASVSSRARWPRRPKPSAATRPSSACTLPIS